MDENKRMISLHEQEFPDSDSFQVDTSARLKKIISSNRTLSLSMQGKII